MKTSILLSLLTASIASAQIYDAPKSLTVTLTNTDCTYVYAVRTPGTTYVSTAFPTSSDVSSVRFYALRTISIIPSAGAGMEAGETDSLKVTVDPMYYVTSTRTWKTSTYENRDMKFYYRQTMLRSRQILDWIDGYTYSCPLVDSTYTPLFRGAHGYRIKVKQFNNTNGVGNYTIIPTFELAN